MITTTIDYDFLTIYILTTWNETGHDYNQILVMAWLAQRSDSRNVVGLNLETKHSLRKKSWTPGVTGLNYAKPMRDNQRFIVPVQGLWSKERPPPLSRAVDSRWIV